MLFNYYSVKVLAGIGRLVTTPLELSVSYHDARQLSGSVSEADSFLYWDSMPNSTKLRNVFNLSLFRKEIAEAFETLDETALHSVFSNICSLLDADQVHYAQALDAASSILHFTITLLPEGMEIASSIFPTSRTTYLLPVPPEDRTFHPALAQTAGRRALPGTSRLSEHTEKLSGGTCKTIHPGTSG